MPDFTSDPNYGLYSPTAISAAQQYGVPTNLFLWQIGQESSWNPTAQNGSAAGIAQFMPATAAQLGVNPYDPTSALYGAAKYDAQLYGQTGDWGKVLQSYGTTANAPASVQAQAAAVLAGSSGSSSSSGVLGTLGNFVASLATGGAVGTGTEFSFSRVTVILVALILIAGGIFLFRPVQDVVNTTVQGGLKEGAKAAGAATLAAATI